MRVEQLTLRNFRNIRQCSYEPDPRLCFLVGPNGQGKTSFLEALGYFAGLRSFRGSKTAEVVHWAEDTAEISCVVTPGDESASDWKTELKVAFRVTDREAGRASKVASINGKDYRSSTQYLSQRFGNFVLGFHAIVFNPSDHELVRGEPALRRAYLDRVLSAEDGEYLLALQKYQRHLDQRNALLKSNPPPTRDLLIGFTQPLVQYAAVLARKRLEWLARLAEPLAEALQRIAPKQPRLRLAYASSWISGFDGFSRGHEDLPSLELLEQSFWNRQSALESAELRSGHSLVGPHRDDWTFLLGEQVLKGHGSQGEIRSALLALKLSEIELFRNKTGHRPIFLLDDFSSELDRERRSFLLRFLAQTDLQTFVTTTEDSVAMGKRVWVLNGSLSERAPEPRNEKDTDEHRLPAEPGP
jgi:DNA replication and repair protein RecF